MNRLYVVVELGFKAKEYAEKIWETIELLRQLGFEVSIYFRWWPRHGARLAINGVLVGDHLEEISEEDVERLISGLALAGTNDWLEAAS